MKARTKKKRHARYERFKRLMKKRCLGAHDRGERVTRWSWMIGFYKVERE